jgi:hypothetical protein
MCVCVYVCVCVCIGLHPDEQRVICLCVDSSLYLGRLTVQGGGREVAGGAVVATGGSLEAVVHAPHTGSCLCLALASVDTCMYVCMYHTYMLRPH